MNQHNSLVEYILDIQTVQDERLNLFIDSLKLEGSEECNLMDSIYEILIGIQNRVYGYRQCYILYIILFKYMDNSFNKYQDLLFHIENIDIQIVFIVQEVQTVIKSLNQRINDKITLINIQNHQELTNSVEKLNISEAYVMVAISNNNSTNKDILKQYLRLIIRESQFNKLYLMNSKLILTDVEEGFLNLEERSKMTSLARKKLSQKSKTKWIIIFLLTLGITALVLIVKFL